MRKQLTAHGPNRKELDPATEIRCGHNAIELIWIYHERDEDEGVHINACLDVGGGRKKAAGHAVT
jgi:hypothetical protein